MKKQTLAIDTPFQKGDAYGALSMPVYHTLAYEFDNASVMSDAFCGRIEEPDYSRVMNPTVNYLELKIKALTGAERVTAMSSGMAAISGALFSLVEQGKNVVSSRHMFGNTYSLLTKTLTLPLWQALPTSTTFPSWQTPRSFLSQSSAHMSLASTSKWCPLPSIFQAEPPLSAASSSIMVVIPSLPVASMTRCSSISVLT